MRNFKTYNRNRMVNLSNSEIISINGGCFAYDAGWAVGFLWELATKDYCGMAEAVVNYDTHDH